MDFPFQNNKNYLIWTRRCGEAGWLKQKILNPTCQAITSPNMNLTQQTSVSNEKITGNKEYSIVSKYTLHAKFCLQINARVCLSNCRWILFFATITFAAATGCCWLGCDDSLLFFGLCQSHETHTYIPYQSFFMNWTYPKFKFFFFGVTVEKICPKNGDSMQIFNLRMIQNDGSTIVLCKHQKTLLLQLQSYAISYYFA